MRLESIKVGRIVNAHGIRGEVRVQPRDGDPYFLTEFDTFYIDGREDGHIDQYVSKRPQFILLSTEVRGYRFENHQPTPESYEVIGKDAFIVDYVRVFDPVK